MAELMEEASRARNLISEKVLDYPKSIRLSKVNSPTVVLDYPE